MKLREPAGCERSGGKSAESTVRARTGDGGGENISVTVCGASGPIVALSARTDLYVKAGGGVRRLFLY